MAGIDSTGFDGWSIVPSFEDGKSMFVDNLPYTVRGLTNQDMLECVEFNYCLTSGDVMHRTHLLFENNPLPDKNPGQN
jgi:hypothetical protein